MIANVDDSKRIVADLEAQVAAASAAETEFAVEAKRISFDALTGNGDAKKALAKIDAEEIKLRQQQRHLRDALEEARRRLAEAERAEAMAAVRENAEAALAIGERLLERARKIDVALATAREELAAYKRDIDSLHLIGCAQPTAQQWLTFGGLAVTAFMMQLPVKVDRDFLAPRERRTFTELSNGWHSGIARWASTFLNREAA
jgi:hypothetical protein